MSQPVAASDVERRKHVRLRLRPDVIIETQKYEGRTYYVIKDPVTLRYYRIKEYERFLLKFFNGINTLQDAQEAYEREYRPERLRFEDLEAFGQQLLTAGLVLNESPLAGEQLFERRKKRKRSQLVQKFTNILYIKIPVIDPDRLLEAMLPNLRWIFTRWFFCLSILLMLSAALLVAMNFDTFRAKLPDYYEFFRFQTLVYLWIALAVVKVIHEFGHGLSCKHYGGEVHEMGFLFLCLSPALYCNVSDAWKLPNKWHRIIISGAGIYVELVIAAIATFVWWNTPNQPLINNLALSMMVVCSVSTFIFNANPLMRFDGYYVVSDWLEIPNLRERSNRFLSRTALKHCLGVEVREEEYMTLGRKTLFIAYAITSWLYRWFITFTILWFLYQFLRPYKLEILSALLMMMACVTLFGMPTYRLIVNIHRRGRLPEMKRWRVIMSSCVVLAFLGFVFFVPVRINKVTGIGVIQARPEAIDTLHTQLPGILDRLLVREGDEVKKGEEIARFIDLKVEQALSKARIEVEHHKRFLAFLDKEHKTQTNPQVRRRTALDIESARSDLRNAEQELAQWDHIRNELLVLRAPFDGRVVGVPPREAVGRMYDKNTPICSVVKPGNLRLCLPVLPDEWQRLRYNVGVKGGALPADIRVMGRGGDLWQGTLLPLPESEATTVPVELSSRAGGPIPVKGGVTDQQVPQTQHYLVYIEVHDPDNAIIPGQLAQAKVVCEPETCATWLWRKVNNLFDLKLW